MRVVALLAFAAASFGLMPSPRLLARVTGAAMGEAYPCQGHGCGCVSARQCWTMCRCQAPAEKVAWARRRGVEVPGYVDRGLLARGAPEGSSCPLCPGEGEPAERPAGAPVLSALGCGGVTGWWSPVSAGVAVVEGAVGVTPAAFAGVRVERALAPGLVGVETPTPPPRRA